MIAKLISYIQWFPNVIADLFNLDYSVLYSWLPADIASVIAFMIEVAITMAMLMMALKVIEFIAGLIGKVIGILT